MVEATPPADLYLYRLAARPPYRWTIYTVLFLAATASLYLRVLEGRADQALPSYVGLLALYGLGMAVVARDNRCRIIYFCFGLLVAAAFTRGPLAAWTRAIGALEAAACFVVLAAFIGISRDGGVRRKTAVLQSKAPLTRTPQEESDE